MKNPMKNILCLFAMMMCCHAAEVKDLSGMWTGGYAYSEEADQAARMVPCSLVITQQHITVLGRMLEVQTFGEPTNVGLSADIKGVVDGDTLFFVKTYDGSGDQAHSISYKLSISKDGKTMKGKWFISAVMEGPVSFTKVDPANIIKFDGQGASNF
jgi:hypothetical protein